MIELGAALMLCLAVGMIVDRALFGAPGRGWIETFGRGLTLGLGAMGSLSLLADSLGLGVSPATVFAAAACLAAVCLAAVLWPWAMKKRPPLPRAESPSRISLTLACAALLLVALASLAFAVYTGWLRPPYQIDALMRWMFKAKALACEGTLLGSLSTDPVFQFTHQRYPPLVSHVANLPRLFTGGFDGRVASAIFPWYSVALACLLYGALSRNTGRLQGALAAVWIATLPLIAFRDGPPPLGVPPGSGAFSALADLPLTLFATGAVLAAWDGVEKRRPRAFLEVGLMLAFAALTKNEGLPLIAGLVLAVLLFAPEKRFQSAALVAGIALSIYFLLWGRIALTFPALDENYPARLNFQALVDGFHRLPHILRRLSEELAFLPNWNLLWPALAALLIASGRAALDRAGRLMLLVFLFQAAAYVLAFMITAWTSPAAGAIGGGGDPVHYLMDLTMGRLLLHLAPILMIAALKSAPLEKRSGAIKKRTGQKPADPPSSPV